MRGRFFVVFLLGALAMPLSSMAQSPEDEMRRMFEQAMMKDDGVHFDAIVNIFIEVRPGQEDSIRALAKSVKDAHSPKQAELVVVDETPSDKVGPLAGMVPVKRVADILDFRKWDGSAELGLSATSGDTQEQAGTLGVKFNRAIGEDWEHKLNLNVDYARRQGETTKERYAADYALKWSMSERGYVYGLFDVEQDRRSGFDHRFAESVGIGYKLMERPDFKWSVEGGPGLRQSKLDTGQSENDMIGVISTTARYWFTPELSVGTDGKAFMGGDRTSLQNILDVKAKINGYLSARMSYQLNYDSNVPLGKHRINTITRATIVYDF